MPWYAKSIGSYDRTSNEAIENANNIYGTLYSRGWTVNAVCGVLGNMGAESGYNPWRWQGDNVGASTGDPWTNIGYGLVQFTPASKYISDPNAQALSGYAPNFSDKSGNPSDGYAQTLFFDQYADYYATTSYPLSYADFKQSTDSPAYLARAWLYNYERPKKPGATEAARAENAEYWYTVLTGEEPPPDPGPGPTPTPELGKGKWWIYMKPKWKRVLGV